MLTCFRRAAGFLVPNVKVTKAGGAFGLVSQAPLGLSIELIGGYS